jgi:hypothetical protein
VVNSCVSCVPRQRPVASFRPLHGYTGALDQEVRVHDDDDHSRVVATPRQNSAAGRLSLFLFSLHVACPFILYNPLNPLSKFKSQISLSALCVNPTTSQGLRRVYGPGPLTTDYLSVTWVSLRIRRHLAALPMCVYFTVKMSRTRSAVAEKAAELDIL